MGLAPLQMPELPEGSDISTALNFPFAQHVAYAQRLPAMWRSFGWRNQQWPRYQLCTDHPAAFCQYLLVLSTFRTFLHRQQHLLFSYFICRGRLGTTTLAYEAIEVCLPVFIMDDERVKWGIAHVVIIPPKIKRPQSIALRPF